MPGLVAIVAAVALSQTPGAPAVVRTCADAPAGSGLAAAGLFEQRPARGEDEAVLLDVSENACAPASARTTAVDTSVTDGLQLRTVPGLEGASVPKGTVASASLVAGRGRHFATYSAVFAIGRADEGYALRLTAIASGGARKLIGGCEAQAPCELPAERRLFDLPPDTARLEWSLACAAESCSTAATGDPELRGLAATLNVYGSTAVVARD